MRGKKIPKNKKKTAKTITTTLIACILLIGILGQIHPTQAEIPNKQTGNGTTYNATEHITGVNTTTETYTTKNNFNNPQRTISLTATTPQNFSLQGDITINIKNINATNDSREIEELRTVLNKIMRSDDWYQVSMTFNITFPKVNISQISVEYDAINYGSLTGTIGIYTTYANGTPNMLVFGSGKDLNATHNEDAIFFRDYYYDPAITLSSGTYAVVLNETSPKGDSDYFEWYYWADVIDGNAGIVFFHDGTSWSSSPDDLPLRIVVLPVDPVDTSKVMQYSSADQVDMKVNGTVVGEDNSISFSSLGTFVFTTNTSLIFQKNWIALFIREGMLVYSSYSVDIDDSFVVWNLTYSLGSVEGGSANTYSDRGVNITFIPSSWSVDSANLGTAVMYGNTVVVSLSDNDAHPDAFVICNSPKANIDFEIEEYDILYGRTVSIRFRFHYGGTGFMADTVTLNGTVPGWSYEGDGWHNITYDTESLDNAGTFVLFIQVNNNEFATLGQVTLYVSEISQKSFADQLFDNIIYIVFLILGVFGAIAFKQLYYAQKQELLDGQNIRRIMVFWESFALYDQIASEAIGNGKIVDKELVSGLFTAIKDITIEVAGATLDVRKVYPNHPYYFVYKGTFYCVLVLKEKPSSRLEEKLLLFAKIVEEKYGETFEKEYRGLYSRGLGIPEIRLDLDDEVMQIFDITPVTQIELMRTFGIIPPTELQDIVTVSLSYEEIEEFKGRDDVKTVLMTGRKLTDQLGKFPLEKLIQEATKALGDIRIAHSATLEALEARLITVAEKATVPEKKPKEKEIKPDNATLRDEKNS